MPIATTNGTKINYKTAGQGEPLVLISGFSANHRSWVAQVPFFKKYFQVIVFDNRGAGKSDKPAGPYTTRMLADDVAGLLDHLKIKKAHVLGISMGGMIAQEFAINHPDRVNRLVLACTFCCKEGESGDTLEQVQTLSLSPAKMSSAMINLAMNKRLNRLTLGFIARLQRRFLNDAGKRGLEGQRAACNNHNTFARLSMIQAPTLVIVGTQDRIIKPTSSEVIAHQIPHSQLIRVEGGSHMLALESRNAFNAEVFKFLKSSA